MACIASDGALLTTARHILETANPPAPAPELARRTGLPLYRVRARLRELVGAGLVIEINGDFGITAAGRARLAG
jgi:DNA-binding IclR family transcriptional regulator